MPSSTLMDSGSPIRQRHRAGEIYLNPFATTGERIKVSTGPETRGLPEENSSSSTSWTPYSVVKVTDPPPTRHATGVVPVVLLARAVGGR